MGTFLGSNSADTMSGGMSADVLQALGGNDWLTGGLSDTLYGGLGDDTLEGLGVKVAGDGNDRVTSLGGNVFLGNGDDWVTASGSTMVVDGEAGNDRLSVNGLQARVFGGLGNDTIEGYGLLFYGGDGDDSINLISSGDQAMSVFGGDGRDRVMGSAARDLLQGDDDSDTLQGRDGSDRIYGGSGNDLLAGDMGDDWLSGGIGDDRFVVGRGRDVVTTGSGADRIATTDNFDFVVMDFTSGQDVLDLRAVARSPQWRLHYMGTAAYDHKPGAIRFDVGAEELTLDLTGDGVTDAKIQLHSAIFNALDLLI